MTEAPAPGALAVPWYPIGRVGLASFVVMLSFACVLPIFPVWTARFTDSLTNVGLATTLAAGVGLILARPIAARMMEGRDRAPTMMLGAIVATAAAATFPASSSLGMVIGLRVVHALGFGLVGTAGIAAITDLAPPARRGEIIGYYGALNAVSLLLGPWIGANLSRHLSFDWSFYAAAILSGLAIVSVVGLPEPAKLSAVVRGRLREVLGWPSVRLIAIAHLFTLSLHGAVLAFLPIRLAGRSGGMTIELFFALDALVLILFRVAMGRRFDRFTRRAVISFGQACMAAAAVCVAVDAGEAPLVAAALLYGLGFGAYVPAASALVGDVVPESHRARGFAVFMLALDLGLALGGVLYGPPADAFGVRRMFYFAAAGPLLGLAMYVGFGRLLRRPVVVA